MQHRPSRSKRDSDDPTEHPVGTPARDSQIDRMIALIGERKKVLDVGCGNGHLASLLTKRQCDVAGVEAKPGAAEEARRYCTEVAIADLDRESLGELFPGPVFDVIVFGDVLSRLREPVRALDEARRLVEPGGYIVASIPNVSHGSIRLALLNGTFDYGERGVVDETQVRFFTAKTVEELFVSAGYAVETLERVSAPIFGTAALDLDPDDFDDGVLADVLADPESETLAFIIKALPLSNDQRLQALTKRFLVANTELAESHRQIARRAQDVADAESSLASRDAAIETLRGELVEATSLLEMSRAEVRRLEEACRKLEADEITIVERRTEAVVQRLVAAQDQHARALETSDRLRVELYESTRAREAIEAKLRDRALEADEDRYVAAFETQFEAQRRLTELEERLSRAVRTSREDLDRERGRVLSLEHELRDESSRGEAERAKRAEFENARDALEVARASADNMADRLQAELDAERALRAEVESRVAESAGRVAELEGARTAFDSAQAMVESACEGLRSELAAERSARGEVERRAAAATAEIAELSVLSESLKVARAAGEIALERLQADLEAERALRGKSEMRSEEFAGHVADLEDACEGLEAARAAAKLASERTLSELRHATAEWQVERAQSARRIAELERETDATTSASETALTRLETITAELESQRERIADLEEERRALDDARANAESVSDLAFLRLEAVTGELEAERQTGRAATSEVENLRSELVAERSLRAEVEAYATQLQEQIDEQAAFLLDLEAKATAALARARANALQLEAAWFDVYAELDEARDRLAHVEELEETLLAVRADASTRSKADELAIVQARETLAAERSTNAALRAESEVLRSLWKSTYSVIRESRGRVDILAAELEEYRNEGRRLLGESRDRADALAAEAATLHAKVAEFEGGRSELERRLLRSERSGQQFERDASAKQAQIDEGAQYARHIELALEATRKAALAERIVMRDYADEIRALGEARCQNYEAIVVRLNREAEENLARTEGLVHETAQLREAHDQRIAELQANVAAASAYGENMRELLAGAERRLLDQTENVVADMQAESAQLVLLIDTVQSSHFWKLKRWLSRLFPRSRR